MRRAAAARRKQVGALVMRNLGRTLALLAIGCGSGAAAGMSAGSGARLAGAASSDATTVGRSGSPRAAPLAIDYSFRIHASLDTIEAEACFRGAPPSHLVSGLAGGAGALRAAFRVERTGRTRLPLAADRIVLEGVEPGACVGYVIALDDADALPGFAVQRRAEAVATNVALWLWRPPVTIVESTSTARFQLPRGMRQSVPWVRQGDHYLLDASAFAFYAYAAFGSFELESIRVAGGTLEVAILAGLAPATRAAVVPWLQHASRLTAQPFGLFPRPRAQLVLIPSDRERRSVDADDDPVHFGTVTRGGGASALMLLASDASREALLRDWVAVHEFSHLLHPFLARDDAWLSEGLATYYQEVLRVRAGVHPEREAWLRLYEGASLGRAATRSLAQESAAMRQTHAFRRIYWAGAAFALLTDAELRRRSGGRLTLDALLFRLAPRVVTQVRPWQARELLAALDAMIPRPLFVPAMQRWVDGPELPDLSALYSAIGVELAGGEVQLRDDAPEAWIRNAIMHP